MITSHQQKGKLERHAVIFRRKVATLTAFATAIFLLCIENVKAFTSPLSSSSALLNENTILFFASGAHTIVKRWKSTPAKNTIRATSDIQIDAQRREAGLALGLRCNHRLSSTALRMMFGTAPSSSSPPMLDMKTSIGAFGGWYNKMDPVARPPVYEDDLTDYTFASPADSWPTSLESDYLTSSQSISSISGIPRKTSNRNPIRRIRKIAGWVSKPMQRIRG